MSLDGSTLCGLQQLATSRCGLCHLTSDEIAALEVDASGRPIFLPPPVPHVMFMGVPCIDIFGHPRSVWHGFPMPAMRVVWGPGHCATSVIDSFISRTIFVLDRQAPGASAVWRTAITARLRTFHGAGSSLSYEETKILCDAGGLPDVPGSPTLTTLSAGLFRMIDVMRRPHLYGADPAKHFYDLSLPLRVGWTTLLGTLNPKAHAFFDHLPRQWLYADDPFFVLRAMEELGEKAHRGAIASWIRSMMTVVSAVTNEDGLVEVMRASLLRFVLTFVGAGIPTHVGAAGRYRGITNAPPTAVTFAD